jgi:hypothetical protein
MTSLRDIFEEARRLDGPLSDRLTHYAAGFRQEAPDLAAAYDQFVSRLQAAEAGDNAPKVGDALLPFALPDQSGALVASDALIGTGPLVISFNRGHWCSFCRLEVASLANLEERVRSAGATLVSITPEIAQYARLLRSGAGLGWPVLIDVDLA